MPAAVVMTEVHRINPMAQRFTPDWVSLQQYTCPDWFRDAKFGIWAHWGPQSVPMVGDWYARRMYVEGDPHHSHHQRMYGHQSQCGYKDIVRLWKAERFEPDGLIDLYKRCGARYFTTLAVHHDNFDCWDSKHHAWNSVRIGPGKDIVGMFAASARAAGLRFGVTEHLERCYSWFSTNKGADTFGPFAGVPYDGNDRRYADFYLQHHDDTTPRYPLNPSTAWMRHWQARIIDLIGRYDPDLLYTDGGVPFGEIGREVIAHFYNRNIERRGGRLEAVYTVKDLDRSRGQGPRTHGDYVEGIGVLDRERGAVDGIHPNPWQSDTCVGGWFYDTRVVYKNPLQIIHRLADIVSKNGNLLLNFPPRPDGTLDEQEVWIAEQIGCWLETNGEAIYGSRPWVRYGEGPTQFAAGHFSEGDQLAFTCDDFRFTTRGTTIYAICMGRPREHQIVIKSLASAESSQGIKAVRLLGGEVQSWLRDPGGLHVQLPGALPCHDAFTLAIEV